ncbi:MAG: class I SAM-dependent methyltransferase [Patescibacteria group bacterium]
MKRKVTSWGKVAGWYDELLGKERTYQRELILPNLIRILSPKKGEIFLDIACGQGFFSRAFGEAGAQVTAVDISLELIAIAKKRKDRGVEYHASPADAMPFVHDASVDMVTIVLALQNIENVLGVFKESARVLKSGGRFAIVLNHPAFRIPKRSSWEWDDAKKIQYRRIEGYLGESVERIQMHPGQNPEDQTVSFHRPIQFYAKAFQKTGFLISRIEEWNSNRKSEPGPRAKAEDIARREIPLFFFIEARRHPRS